MRVMRALSVVVALVVLGPALTVWASGTMQKAPSGTMQKAPTTQQKAPTSGAAPAVKVEAQSLTVTPSAPQGGQQATVKFVFKNTGTGTVSVPWSIHLYTGNKTLNSGTKTNLEAGATFEATATWTPASAGNYTVQGYVDPSGGLKNSAPVSAQIRELSVAVTQTSAGSGPVGTPSPQSQVAVQILDHERARAAGAGFNNGQEGAAACFQLGQFAPSQLPNHAASDPPSNEASVIFLVNCGASFGARATPEAFMNWELKNGWKVKRYEVTKPKMENGEWQFPSPPVTGSTRPYVKAHIWANPGGSAFFGVKIYIEGPQGTDPYQ